jgi:SAM-dependent methyltransferase
MRIGLRTVRREPALGLKRLALPVSYWRTAEFLYVCRRLQPLPGGTVLDLGSPKELAVIIAREAGVRVVATDIQSSAVELSRRYARAQRIDGREPGTVHSEVQDGRSLQYRADCFDAAFSVSVLEHIPDDGDTAAIRELLRVTKPGGRIVFTVPFAPKRYDTFVSRPVYERAWQGQPVFYQRHYDLTSLKARLLEPAGAAVVDLELWGEGRARVERLLTRLGSGRTCLSPLEPLLASVFLRRIDGRMHGHPMAAMITLQKPPGV